MKGSISNQTRLRTVVTILLLVSSCKSHSPKKFQEPQKIMKKVINEPSDPGCGFNEFREAVGFRESSNNYTVVNRFGYMGKYQFGRMALTDLGITDHKAFLKNPQIQDRAFEAFCRINKFRLRHSIEKHVGKVINGIPITESGIIAAAHLVGSGAVKKYLNSNGERITTDGNNVSVENYLDLFKGYRFKIEAERSINLAV